MDRIELAERRYADIVGDELSATAPGERYWRMPVSKILAWVNEYVLPAIDEVYRRPKFLDHATWPQRLLVPGAGGPHRAAVERVDQALVAEARLLHRLARNKLVARAMENGTRTHRGLCSDAVTISAEEDAATPNRVPQEPLLLDYVAGIQAMSQRNWTDLVCSDDYFVPTGGMMRTTPLPEGVTEGVLSCPSRRPCFMWGIPSRDACCSVLVRCSAFWPNSGRSFTRPFEKRNEHTSHRRQPNMPRTTNWAKVAPICSGYALPDPMPASETRA